MTDNIPDSPNPSAFQDVAIASSRCPDTPSECNLVIDDDYEENVAKAKAKRVKAIRNSEEPTHINCNWEDCGELFLDEDKFYMHVEGHAMNTESYEDMYTCRFESCEYMTRSYSAFARHVIYHSYHERLKNIGINVIERQDLPKCLSTELYEFGEISPFECKWNRCNFKTESVLEFHAHVKSHSIGMPKYCSKGEFNKCEWLGCTTKFASMYKLMYHFRTHTAERLIACPTCGNMFSTKPRFADHRQRQIPIELQSYQCSECSKLFPTERLLRDHMRSHINHYKCNLCDMTCSRPSMLALHVRHRHMEERPFKCRICKFRGVTKAAVDKHMNTHCPDSLYTCEYCDFGCRSSSGLDSHIQRVHMGDPLLYACHCCEEKFRDGRYLTKHLISKHDFNWPAGHSKFRYKQESNGLFRLQTVRYESLEITREMMAERPPAFDASKYELLMSSGMAGRLNSFDFTFREQTDSNEDGIDEAEPGETQESGKEVVIDINDVDEEGVIIKQETIISKEIIQAADSQTGIVPGIKIE